MNEEDKIVRKNIHVPLTCEKCGKANPEYKGVGEYKCAECGFTMYDDFGLVRNYLEAHAGATQSEVSRETGVAMDTIRQFLKEERLEIVAGSNVMLTCEICNAPIRSGRYCPECAIAVEKRIQAEKAAEHKKALQGFGKGTQGESGAIRFRR